MDSISFHVCFRLTHGIFDDFVRNITVFFDRKTSMLKPRMLSAKDTLKVDVSDPM